MADRTDRRLPRETRRSVTALLVVVFGVAAAGVAQVTVLGKLVYDLTGSEFDLGLLGLAEFAPAALLVLVAGPVADRVDRRRLVAIGTIGEAVVAMVLAGYSRSRSLSVGVILALVVVYGSCQAFVAPALRSLPADMVAAVHVPRLIARRSTAWQAAIIAGPVLAGFLYGQGAWVPLLVGAALLVAGAAGILGVEVVEVARPSAMTAPVPAERAAVEASRTPGWLGATVSGGLHEAFEGLRFVRSQPILLGAISLDLFAVLFGGAVTLLPAIAKDRLGVGSVGLGWLRAAGGIGAAATTLVVAVHPVRRWVGRTLLVVVAIFGIWTVALGLTRDFALAFVAMLILSGADAVSVFIRASLVPLVTPNDRRGRVLAVENVFIGASNELGGFESGVAGQLLGTSASVVLGGVATLVIAAAWWGLFPTLRRVDRFPTGAEPTTPPA